MNLIQVNAHACCGPSAHFMEEDEIREIARLMLRQYGELAVRLMETRARNCARYGEPDSAAFWQNVREEVSKLAASAEAAAIVGRRCAGRNRSLNASEAGRRRPQLPAASAGV